RYSFLHAIQSHLTQSGWDFKTDSGWTAVDLEIPTDSWSRLKLTTVTEDLEQGRRTFRCRVQSSWSLPAKVTFGISIFLLLIVIVAFAATVPWLWLALVALPLIAWFFDDNRQEYQRALVGIVDHAATSKKLVKLDAAGNKVVK